MGWFRSRVLWGSLLILAGIGFLLQSLGYIQIQAGEMFWGMAFLLGGAAFMTVYFQNKEHWWAFIPGFTLFGIAALLLLEWLVPGGIGNWGGALVLFGIGLGFIAVYLVRRENWWALIPAGVMATLSAVVLGEEVLEGIETGGLFFIGLGLTFALLALIPNQQGSMAWAWIPAGILGVMGVFLLFGIDNLFAYILPLGLIILGGLLVWRTLRSSE